MQNKFLDVGKFGVQKIAICLLKSQKLDFAHRVLTDFNYIEAKIFYDLLPELVDEYLLLLQSYSSEPSSITCLLSSLEILDQITDIQNSPSDENVAKSFLDFIEINFDKLERNRANPSFLRQQALNYQAKSPVTTKAETEEFDGAVISTRGHIYSKPLYNPFPSLQKTINLSDDPIRSLAFSADNLHVFCCDTRNSYYVDIMSRKIIHKINNQQFPPTLPFRSWLQQLAREDVGFSELPIEVTAFKSEEIESKLKTLFLNAKHLLECPNIPNSTDDALLFRWSTMGEGRTYREMPNAAFVFSQYMKKYESWVSVKTGMIKSVAINKSKGLALTASDDGYVRAWNLGTGHLEAIMMHSMNPCSLVCVDVSLDGKQTLSVSAKDSPEICVWDSEFKLANRFKLDCRIIRYARFDATGNTVLIQCDDAQFVRYDLTCGQLMNKCREKLTASIPDMHFPRQYRLFDMNEARTSITTLSSISGGIKVWDIEKSKLIYEFPQNIIDEEFIETKLPTPEALVQVSGDENIFAVCMHGNIHLIDKRIEDSHRQHLTKRNDINDFQISGDCTVGITAHENGELSVWDLQQGLPFGWTNLLRQKETIQNLQIAPSQPGYMYVICPVYEVVFGFNPKQERPWSIAAKPSRRISTNYQVDVSGTSVLFSAENESGKYDILEVNIDDEQQRTILENALESSLSSFNLSMCNRFIACCDFDKPIKIVDREMGQLVRTLKEPDRPIQTLAWLESISAIASGHYQDNRVILWDVSSSEKQIILETCTEAGSTNVSSIVEIISNELIIAAGEIEYSSGGTIWVWQPKISFRPQLSRTISNEKIVQLKVSADEKYLYVRLADNSIQILRTSTLEEVAECFFPHGISSISDILFDGSFCFANPATGMGQCKPENIEVRPPIAYCRSVWVHDPKNENHWSGLSFVCPSCGTRTHPNSISSQGQFEQVVCSECGTEFLCAAPKLLGQKLFEIVHSTVNHKFDVLLDENLLESHFEDSFVTFKSYCSNGDKRNFSNYMQRYGNGLSAEQKSDLLQIACERLNGEFAKMLIESGAIPTKETSLLVLLGLERDTLYLAIENGLDVNTIFVGSTNNSTLLNDAAKFHDFDLVNNLINLGADVNLGSHEKQFPLTSACQFATDENVVKLLVLNGANISPTLKDDWGPVRASLSRNDHSILEFFQKRGANLAVDDVDHLGRTKLMEVCELNGKLEFARILVENGADVNLKCNEGKTALMHASSFNDKPEVVRFLFRWGANLKIRSNTGKTAYQYARGRGHTRSMSVMENLSDVHSLL